MLAVSKVALVNGGITYMSLSNSWLRKLLVCLVGWRRKLYVDSESLYKAYLLFGRAPRIQKKMNLDLGFIWIHHGVALPWICASPKCLVQLHISLYLTSIWVPCVRKKVLGFFFLLMELSRAGEKEGPRADGYRGTHGGRPRMLVRPLGSECGSRRGLARLARSLARLARGGVAVGEGIKSY
jgi:hypothetical protein